MEAATVAGWPATMLSLFSSLLPSSQPEMSSGQRKRLLNKAGIRIYAPKDSHNVDFLFIHDAVLDPSSEWKNLDAIVNAEWPLNLSETFPSARILIYEYERTWVKTLSDILDPENIKTATRDLLQYLDSRDNRSSVPVVVFGHGFGGLLYEQAVVWAERDPDSVFWRRTHAAFLFGTPHFGGGLAEWAIIVAKAHGIPCAKTAQAQDWSAAMKEQASTTAKMQKQFRQILQKFDSEVKSVGLFSTLPEDGSNLILSSEWTVLPEMLPIAVDSSQSSLTWMKPSDETGTFKAIVITLGPIVQKLSRKTPKPALNLIDGLARLISETMLPSIFDVEGPKKFMPEGELEKLISRPVIQKQLGMGPAPLTTKEMLIIDFIHRHATKFFAILVCCRVDSTTLLTTVESAMTSNFDDKQLPIGNPLLLLDTKRPSPFQRLGSTTLDLFYEHQWSFLAPVLNMHEFTILDYDAMGYVGVVLPFVERKNWDLRIHIPLSHLQLKNSIPPEMDLYIYSQTLSLATSKSQNHPAVGALLPMGQEADDIQYFVLTEISSGKQWRDLAERIKAKWHDVPFARPITAFKTGNRHYILSRGPEKQLGLRTLETYQEIIQFLHELRELVLRVEYLPIYEFDYDLFMRTGPHKAPRDTKPSRNGSIQFALNEETRLRRNGYASWCMVCIILETVIRTLHGPSELDKFRGDVRGGSPYSSEERELFRSSVEHFLLGIKRGYSFFPSAAGGRKVRISAFLIWIHQLQQNEPQFSAIKDVLGLAGFNGIDPQNMSVEDAISLRLDYIIKRAEAAKNYASSEEDRSRNPISGSLPRTAKSHRTSDQGVRTFEQQRDWQIIVDNDFTRKVVSTYEYPLPRLPNLCDSCQEVNFLDIDFKMSKSISSMREASCPLCKLLWKGCQRISLWDETRDCNFERIGSNIYLLEKSYPPVLSLCRTPDFSTPAEAPIQIGLPQLPVDMSTTFNFIKTWLEDCDINHPDCSPNKKELRAPSKLIDISAENVRLCEVKPHAQLDYAALSYLWGKSQPPVQFNKQKFSFDDLPKTYHDAIRTTRALGIRYLWIDALCNDERDDWGRISEDVFSGAYCVLGVCRSISRSTGFLEPRPEREFITLPDEKEGGTLYVCEAIDDFTRDVSQSPLYSRAWTFQERIFARRSVFFTANQVYLECGNGIRCETLSFMHNQAASFLGDPHFPSVALKAPLVTKDHLYQSLYSYYSQLTITADWDRGSAISAIEKRLEDAFKCVGRYGIFGKELLHCSLLWCRHIDSDKLETISLPLDMHIPSWSWQAHKGRIDYLVTSTLDTPTEFKISRVFDEDAESVVLTAQALEFSINNDELSGDFIVYDDPEDTFSHLNAKCVVLGGFKGPISTTRRKCVLIVSEVLDTRLSLAIGASPVRSKYKRIGAGFLSPRSIVDGPGVEIQIE